MKRSKVGGQKVRAVRKGGLWEAMETLGQEELRSREIAAGQEGGWTAEAAG